jgi:glycosyltransferase involved in cell wall biosynthesis
VVVLCTPSPVDPADRPGVETVLVEIPASGFLTRSEAAARAVASIARPGDRVEVQDFEGLGFWMLAHRAELGLEGTPLTIRFHGPYDLLAGAMDTPPGDWGVPRAMEHGAFEMADAVLVPAPGHAAVLRERYGVPGERLALAPPPVPDLAGRLEPGGRRLEVAAVGRLGEMKGSQDLVRAAVSLREEGVDLRVRFIGDDGWSTTSAAPMSEWLTSLIPERHRDGDPVGRPGPPTSCLPARHSTGDRVVVPSRFESFCLAAHEARRLGLPVVVPDLAAFRGIFSEETGALVYDGTVEGLAGRLRRLGEQPGPGSPPGREPRPRPRRSLGSLPDDPEPRHPRAQAGLATAAVKRVEAATAREAATPAGGALLRRAFRYLPAPVARAAARLAPRSLKDRVRGVASWPQEQARRAREARLKQVEDRIAAGGFPEVDDPDVTVVIPVYDQGRFLPEALASVYEQTHPSWEIVVVDDGSTDPETVALLDSLARPRLGWSARRTGGCPGARNAGMAVARGRYLVPLDADDELHPEFLSRLLPALDADPEAAFAHCHARLFGDVDAVWVTRPFNPYWQLLGNGVVGCVVLRADAWRRWAATTRR